MKNISEPRRSQRPIIITIICILGFLGLLTLIPILYSPLSLKVGSWYRPYLIFSGLVGLVCLLGLWRMRQWAPTAYALYVIVGLIVSLYHNVWSAQSIIIPLLVCVVAFAYGNRMN
ncbi:MAG TPA: hypothetical protein DCS93_10115 [Microscillaceae bacterium]|nr:hypothetical protein [Microscillaceae bacterium]